MFKWLKNWKEFTVRQYKRRSKNPYVEIIGENFDPATGKIRFEFDWNSAFVQQLRDAGFQSDIEEEVIRLWFQSIANINAEKLLEEDAALAQQAKINPASHPNLS